MFRVILISILFGLAGCDQAQEIYSNVSNKISPPSFDRQLNEEHPFEVKACEVYYKGQLLPFKASIEEWVKILGPYSREPSAIPELYVWDELGLAARTPWDVDLVSTIEWFYRREPEHSMEFISNPKNYTGGAKTAQRMVELELAWPKGRFKDSIILDGLLMDDQFNLEELNQSRREKGLDPFYLSNYRNIWMIYKRCNEANYKFEIEVNEADPSKVNSLIFADMRKY